MANFKTIPPRIKVRVKKRWGWFCVLARNRKGWAILDRKKDRNEALAFIEDYHNNKDIQWSVEIKIYAGWVCEEPGCGELDKTLLEAHHIRPKEQYPEMRHDPDNGECLCIFHHAGKHTGQVRLMILARLGLKLYGRLYPHKKAEIQRMAI